MIKIIDLSKIELDLEESIIFTNKINLGIVECNQLINKKSLTIPDVLKLTTVITDISNNIKVECKLTIEESERVINEQKKSKHGIEKILDKNHLKVNLYLKYLDNLTKLIADVTKMI